MTVGRWEWRGFGAAIVAAERRLEELTPSSLEESDETYLLAVRSEAPVKIRDGLLDVKRLVQVSDEGLQQWIPIAKEPFPVEAEKLADRARRARRRASRSRARRTRWRELARARWSAPVPTSNG